MVKTDQNSIYRQVFNRDTKFFLYVIDNTEPPYVIKLHIANYDINEISKYEIKQSLNEYVIAKTKMPQVPKDMVIEIKQYPLKSQLKVFIRFYKSKDVARTIFKSLHKEKEFSFYDNYNQFKFNRQMRAYLVKEEGILEKLAI